MHFAVGGADEQPVGGGDQAVEDGRSVKLPLGEQLAVCGTNGSEQGACAAFERCQGVLWINDVRKWGEVDGYSLPVVGAVTWFDEGTPWATFRVEEIVYNADVGQYVRAAGP